MINLFQNGVFEVAIRYGLRDIFNQSLFQSYIIHDRLRRLGFSIPEDLGIMGFDNTEVAHLLDLTTLTILLFSKLRMHFPFSIFHFAK